MLLTIPLNVIEFNALMYICFFTAGKVGDWMEHLTSEQSAFIDKICQMYLKPAGIEPQFQTGDKKAVELTSKKQSEPTGQK